MNIKTKTEWNGREWITYETLEWAEKTWIIRERANQAVLVRDTDPIGNQRLWLLPAPGGKQSWKVDWRSWNPFFTRNVTAYVRNPERPLNPRWVRRGTRPVEGEERGHCITSYRHYPSQERVYGAFIRGNLSKFAAYRILRQRAIHERGYLGQVYRMFVGPIGFLP